MHRCQIKNCPSAALAFPHYWVFVLDDGTSVAVCKSCAGKIREARKVLGVNPLGVTLVAA